MLASLDTPPIAAPSASWADIGRQALLEALRGVTGGSALPAAVTQSGLYLPTPPPAASKTTRNMLIVAGVIGVVVVGAVLLTGREVAAATRRRR